MAQALSGASSAKLVDYLAANQTVQFDSVQFFAMQSVDQERDPVQPELRVQLESQTTASQSGHSYQTYPAAPTQPPLYPPMGQPYPQHTPIVIHTATRTYLVPVGRDPTFIRCPSCQSDVVTVIHSTSSKRTHAAALILCFVG